MENKRVLINLKKEGNYCMTALRRGLMMIVPVLLLGSFSLVVSAFPMASYQELLAGLLDGQVVRALSGIYEATLGHLAVYLILTVSVSYGRQVDTEHILFYPIVALTSYIGFVGKPSFTAEWILMSLVITLVSSILLNKLSKALKGKTVKYITGTDYHFHLVLESLIPIVIIICGFVLASRGFGVVFDKNTADDLKSLFFDDLFSMLGNNIFSVILYLTITHLFWFVGVHGSNLLEQVSAGLFEQGIEINAALIKAGEAPTEIFTKTFLDTFASMGGVGSSLCLLIALMMISKRASSKRLGKLSAIPVLFNINETLMFGYPVIFNRILLIPFILVPILDACLSGALMYIGLVPMTVHTVGWTVPVFFSGYYATGSIRGSLLQLINILMGVIIYLPFVRLSEKRAEERLTNEIRHLEKDLMKSEQRGKQLNFFADGYIYGTAAKSLAMDLRIALENKDLMMYYQPQMNQEEKVHGGEALLRWKHPIAGFILPPLIIQLAIAEGIIDELGKYIISSVLTDIKKLELSLSDSLRISINISPYQLDSDDFVEWVAEEMEKAGLKQVSLMFEFTEQVALSFDDRVRRSLQQLTDLGIEISMDDFGMGHSSIMYLNESSFQEVKLDGKLVRQVLNNARSREIIKAITNLSKGLQFQVVAEYVETIEQKEMLHELGCDIYQGYLYSPPIPVDEFAEFVKQYEKRQGNKAG